ncbi:MAG: dicarboxylate/amino acid:cation symporter [Chromatiaceae bacterium]|nr:dicarboxylate/amino acid:cation symporter [Chromatiaceae bacterium]
MLPLRLRTLYSTPVALFSGVVLAILVPSGAAYVAWLGEIFLSLLKVLILPLILVSIYASLTSGTDLKRLGGRTLGYYLMTSSFAAALGTLVGFALAGSLPAGLLSLEQVDTAGADFSLDRFIQNLIPSNIFASFAEGNILHIVVISIFAALASRYLAENSRRFLLDGAVALNDLLMQMLEGILAVAPVGILSLVYASLAGMQWGEIFQLRSFVWAVTIAVLVHALLFLPGLYFLRTRRSAWRFLGAVKVALMTAFSTASSSATYPVSKRVLEENAGLSPRITGFTLPLGATLNMDGSALYQSILLIFMSQLAGADISLLQALFIVLLTMASSAGTAGIPGGGVAMMAFMLDLLGLPQTYLALYLVVDRFFDYPITVINVWGDLIVTALVDRDCGQEP